MDSATASVDGELAVNPSVPSSIHGRCLSIKDEPSSTGEGSSSIQNESSSTCRFPAATEVWRRQLITRHRH